jgi:hypothetical protein
MLNTLCLNIWGVSNSSSLNRLKALSQMHKIILLAILEPLIDVSKLTETRLKIKFHAAISNSCSSIWIFWDQSLHCDIIYEGGQSVTLLCHHKAMKFDFIFTAVFAKCIPTQRQALWRQLQHISSQDLP